MPVAFLLLLKSVRQKRKDVFNYFDRPSVPEHFVLLRFGAFPFVPSGYRLKSCAFGRSESPYALGVVHDVDRMSCRNGRGCPIGIEDAVLKVRLTAL